MKFASLLIGGLALSILSACGPAGQPRTFRVAVDTTPIKALADAQCFRGNMPSPNTLQEQGFRAETNWTVWDGTTEKQYMDMGSSKFSLGDSPDIEVDDLIEGKGDLSFTGTRQRILKTGIIQTEITTVVATWTDLGATPTGSLILDAKYQCQDGMDRCPSDPLKRSCKVQVNFWARKIENSQITMYGNNAAMGGITVSTN